MNASGPENRRSSDHNWVRHSARPRSQDRTAAVTRLSTAHNVIDVSGYTAKLLRVLERRAGFVVAAWRSKVALESGARTSCYTNALCTSA